MFLKNDINKKDFSMSSSVILIDDDRDELIRIKNVLNYQNINVQCYANAMDSFEYICKHQEEIDVILISLSMSSISGIQYASIIRAEGVNTPFIFMSHIYGKIDQSDFNVISKTCNSEFLMKKINVYLKEKPLK